jgi:hypothetical protein
MTVYFGAGISRLFLEGHLGTAVFPEKAALEAFLNRAEYEFEGGGGRCGFLGRHAPAGHNTDQQDSPTIP